MAEDKRQGSVAFEEVPLTRSEYISAMVHLYRGEMQRALTWRQRLDASTNWAVITAGAMLTFLFSQENHHHVVAVLGMMLVFFMLCYEARRFRYFDVWRSRVRELEENFYVPLLRRDLTSPVENWAFLVAEDLMTPRFKISFLVALRARLLRNYIPIFLVLFGAWLAKITLHPSSEVLRQRYKEGEVVPIIEALKHTGVGFVPALLVDAFVAALLLFLTLVGVFARPRRTMEHKWWSHRSDESVDELS